MLIWLSWLVQLWPDNGGVGLAIVCASICLNIGVNIQTSKQKTFIVILWHSSCKCSRFFSIVWVLNNIDHDKSSISKQFDVSAVYWLMAVTNEMLHNVRKCVRTCPEPATADCYFVANSEYGSTWAMLISYLQLDKTIQIFLLESLYRISCLSSYNIDFKDGQIIQSWLSWHHNYQ